MKSRLFFVSLILLLCTIFCTPIFATDGDTASSVFPVGLYEDKVYDSLASGTKAAHDVNDVYLVLYDDIRPALRGQNSSSVYSLPRIASYLSASPEGTTVGVGTMVSELMYDTIDIKNYSAYLPSIKNSVDSLGVITWQNTNAQYLGAKRSPTGSVVSSWVTGETNWFFGFNFGGSTYSSNQPMTLRLWIPFDPWNQIGSPNFRLKSIQYVSGGSAYPVNFDNANVFFEPAINYGSYLYIFNFKDYNLGYTDIYFEVEYIGSGSPQMSGDRQGNAFFIPFDSVANQQLKVAFYQSTISSDISSLVSVYASSDLIQAKQAQQPVEDAVLSDFSGSGSESLKLSDIGTVKNTSGALKTLFNAGGDIVKVFNVLRFSSMYGFFSNDVANETETWFNATTTRSSGSEFISDADYNLNLQRYLDSLTYDSR